MSFYTIHAREADGSWLPVLGALFVGGTMHHGVEWGSEQQAYRAAKTANPDIAPADLLVVNDATGEARTVAEIQAEALVNELADLRGVILHASSIGAAQTTISIDLLSVLIDCYEGKPKV